MTLCIAKGQNYWAWPKLFCLQLFLHIISSNKTFSWEYSSITAHWQSASPSSLKPLTPSIPCFKQSSHRTLASHPPTGPTVAFPFLSALDLAEPGVLLLPGMFLLRSTALLISPSDRGPTIPSKGAPPPTSSGSISIYLLTNTIIISKIFIMTCMFACIFINTRKETFSLGSPKVFLESGYITFSRSSPNAYRLEE